LQNYFNYFTEIEDHFQRRRGSILLLSTIDWALIETWREAGIPLAAVLRGIDDAFDKHEAKKARPNARKINGLAWTAQAVMLAYEDMREASVGMNQQPDAALPETAASGFEQERIAAHLLGCAEVLQRTTHPETCLAALQETAMRLRGLAEEVGLAMPKLEELDRTLLVMDEKLFAAILAAEPEQDLVLLKEQAARELAPYRSRMQALQIRQIEQQFLHKRLVDKYKLPRLSLFYMSQG
jgi:lambda repressor-like predicted transcriptional regulator